MNQQTLKQGSDSCERSVRFVDRAPPTGQAQSMDNRIRNLETHAVETRDRLTRIETTLEHVATVDALATHSVELRKEISDSKSELRKEMGDMKSELVKAMGDMNISLIKHMESIRSDLMKWFVAVALALAALAFTAAKYVP
jgi:ribosome-interacting GTPase 1